MDTALKCEARGPHVLLLNLADVAASLHRPLPFLVHALCSVLRHRIQKLDNGWLVVEGPMTVENVTNAMEKVDAQCIPCAICGSRSTELVDEDCGTFYCPACKTDTVPRLH